MKVSPLVHHNCTFFAQSTLKVMEKLGYFRGKLLERYKLNMEPAGGIEPPTYRL